MNPTLQTLHIRDFAIIQSLDVDFAHGFTVFSGETGAGKSILFDALGLVLGDRADANVVRDGAKRSEVSAAFDLTRQTAAQAWLEQQGLQDEDEPTALLIRRQVLASGQSRAYINASPAKLGQLRELASLLVDIHGQHAHQSLLKPASQRDLLDQYGQLDTPKAALVQAYGALSEVEAQLAALDNQDGDQSQRCELLRYQLQELDELQPEADDFAQLEIDFKRQSEAENLLQQAGQTHQLLYAADESVYDQAQTALQQLQELCDLDPRFEAALKLVDQAQIDLKEAASLCEDLAGDIDPDPQALQALSQRLDLYQSQARKHRVQPEELAAHWQHLQQELQRLQSSEQDRDALQSKHAALIEQYAHASQALSQARQKAAKKLAAAITKTVQPLGLPHAQCEVAVQWQAEARRTAHGQDKVELRVAMNPGHKPAALAKVASGGELARTSLAIQVVCLNQSPVPVLLFDEVDVGIGGGVAETVGRRLKSLAAGYQVFCVTHQPQVAALADTHFQVSKQVANGLTQTQVEALPQDQRIEELARMLGGVKITQQTRAHAQEMLELGARPA